MNKRAIRSTAICYWSKDDDAFVVESPLFETIAGVGETEKESRKVFEDLLDDAYEAYLEGRVPGYEKPGRPVKGGVALNLDVKPETKQFIKKLANDFQCSQGEVTDFLAFAYQKQKENSELSYIDKSAQSQGNDQLFAVYEKIQDLKASLNQLETKLPKTLVYKRPTKKRCNRP